MAETPAAPGEQKPRPLGPTDIAWANNALRFTRNTWLLTTAVDGSAASYFGTRPYATALFSAPTRRLTGELQLVWRSRPTSEHSKHIERDCAFAAAMGGPALADVEFLFMDSGSPGSPIDPNSALKMQGKARRMDDPNEEGKALAVLNTWRHRRAKIQERSLEPDNRYAEPFKMYVATIVRATMPVDIELHVPGEGVFPIDYSHAPLEVSQLHNFE